MYLYVSTTFVYNTADISNKQAKKTKFSLCKIPWDTTCVARREQDVHLLFEQREGKFQVHVQEGREIRENEFM